MARRPSPRRVAAERAWQTFVHANRAMIERAGLPPEVFHSVARFDAFLRYGDPGAEPRTPERQSTEAYASLVRLVESYFVAGYEWFTPAILHPDDIQRLCTRFGAGSAD